MLDPEESPCLWHRDLEPALVKASKKFPSHHQSVCNFSTKEAGALMNIEQRKFICVLEHFN